MKLELGIAMKAIVFFAIIVTIAGSGFMAGWYIHSFYGTSNELAVNQSDATTASKIYEQQFKELQFVDDWKESINTNNPCANLSFDELYKINQQGK